MNSELRQDDSLSPIIFDVILEKVIREMEIGPHEGIIIRHGGRSMVCRRYIIDGRISK